MEIDRAAAVADLRELQADQCGLFRIQQRRLAFASRFRRLQRIFHVEQRRQHCGAVIGEGGISAAFLLLDARADLPTLENGRGDAGDKAAEGGIEQVADGVARGVDRAAQAQGRAAGNGGDPDARFEVPEPGSLAVVLAALASLVGVWRWRRRKADESA